jgi:hypothetical protein
VYHGVDDTTEKAANVTERKFTAEDGRTWVVRVRPEVRRNEVGNHVTLELTTHNEARVVSCRSVEWYVAEPDFPALLAHSVAAGASRSMAARSADNSGE